jgi:hypothetical protein
LIDKKTFVEDYISDYLEEQGLAYEDLTPEEIEELKAEAGEAYSDMIDADDDSEEGEAWEEEEEEEEDDEEEEEEEEEDWSHDGEGGSDED